MIDQDIPVTLIIASLMIGLFLLVRSGLFKSWYILETLPGLLSARMIYAAFASGLFFLYLYLLPYIPGWDPDNVNIWFLLIFFFSVLPLYFMYRPPFWVVPEWVKWLEREYGYCLDILIEEARLMGRWTWEIEVMTRAGMQAWIDDVFTRRQKDVDEYWKQAKVWLMRQQRNQEGIHYLKPGTLSPEYTPQHRLHDREVSEEEIIEVVRLKNSKYVVVMPDGSEVPKRRRKK
jgi:hypothetical protein